MPIMTNWLLQDTVTNQVWDLSVNGGMFYLALHTVNDPIMRNPIIQDSLLLGVYYQLSVVNGEISWAPVSQPTADQDTVYMYDSYLNQWWVIQMTEGMFNVNTSSAPGGSNGFYPLDYYYKWLTSSKNVKYLIKVNAKKSFNTKADIILKGRKSLGVSSTGKGVGKKQVSHLRAVKTVGSKSVIKKLNSMVMGRKNFNSIKEISLSGNKSFPVIEQVSISGKKDLSPILMALDLL